MGSPSRGYLGDISHLIPSGGISCIPVTVWSCYLLVASEQSQSAFFPGSHTHGAGSVLGWLHSQALVQLLLLWLTGALSSDHGSSMANLRPSESKPVRSLHWRKELMLAVRRRAVCDSVMLGLLSPKPCEEALPCCSEPQRCWSDRLCSCTPFLWRDCYHPDGGHLWTC